MGPLLTLDLHETLRAAGRSGAISVECSLDLGRTTTTVAADATGWTWHGQRYPYLEACRDRTVYFWTGSGFEPASRYTHALIKLVPTEWGPPTFEIDGIKMLPTAQVSPYQDAERKVALIEPAGQGDPRYLWRARILRGMVPGGAGRARAVVREEAATCSGCAASIRGRRRPTPACAWSRATLPGRSQHLPGASFDAILHDPPRFGIAGELYSQAFYDQLARVLKRKGRLFHYTGTPNKLTSGRDVPAEVARRLRNAGFTTAMQGDGVLAVKHAQSDGASADRSIR